MWLTWAAPFSWCSRELLAKEKLHPSASYVVAAAAPGISGFHCRLCSHLCPATTENLPWAFSLEGNSARRQLPQFCACAPLPHHPAVHGWGGVCRAQAGAALAPRAFLGLRRAVCVSGFSCCCKGLIGTVSVSSHSEPLPEDEGRQSSWPMCPWPCDLEAKGCAALQHWITPVSPHTPTIHIPPPATPPHTHTLFSPEGSPHCCPDPSLGPGTSAYRPGVPWEDQAPPLEASQVSGVNALQTSCTPF